MNNLPAPLIEPIDPAKFNDELVKFSKTSVGQLFVDSRSLGIVNGKLKYFEIKAITMGQQWEEEVGADIYASTFNFTQNFIKNAPKTLSNVKYSSPSFA